MEDVLSAYKRAYDPKRPLLGMDEGGKVLQKQTRDPVPMRPGAPKREDYSYGRAGMCSVFLAVEPLAGKRIVHTSARRTKADWAFFMRELIDVHYPEAEKIILIMDNLNTHSPASFYEVFEPAEAWRLSQKLEIHFTPVHGSWLNVAEIELSVLARDVLKERLPSIECVQERIAVWQEQRNARRGTISWQFTPADARIKLQRLYPSIEG
jgi:hypothetical protein